MCRAKHTYHLKIRLQLKESIIMNATNHITPFTHFTREELNHLSEEEIISGFKLKNPQITQKYFYGFCKIAYITWNERYQLLNKEELDFYTISNDYYLKMVRNNWVNLEEDRETASLQTWIIGGFRYSILDALERYNMEQEHKFKSLPIENYSEKISNLADHSSDIDLRDIRDSILKDDTNKIIFDKYHIQGYNMKEIAEVLNITPSAVSQRYKSIIKTITHYYK